MTTLFINACARERSRTRELAEHVLSNLGGVYKEVDLAKERIAPLDGERLARRDRLLESGDLLASDFRYANQFAAAEQIVIAAPFWDLSFPAALKNYIEAINVCGITFTYENDLPSGLCRASRAIYVTTAGGFIDTAAAFGQGYLEALCRGFYEIPAFTVIAAEGLDIDGADVEAILGAAHARIDEEIG